MGCIKCKDLRHINLCSCVLRKYMYVSFFVYGGILYGVCWHHLAHVVVYGAISWFTLVCLGVCC